MRSARHVPLIVLILVVGLALFAAPASAHTVTQCQLTTTPACDQGVAFSVLGGFPAAHCAAHLAGAVPSSVQTIHDPNGKRYTASFSCRNASGALVSVNQSHFTVYRNLCSQRQQYNGAFPNGQFKPKSGSLSCDLGCETMWTHNADGSVNGMTEGSTCKGEDYDSDQDCAANTPGYYYNRQVGVCEPPEPECPGGVSTNSLGNCEPEPCPAGMLMQQDGTCKNKNNECPAGQVKSPDGKCLPGEGQCAQGEARGKDGTCKRDGNNNGKPDEEEEGGGPGEGEGEKTKEEFSGGDDCSRPPSCSGSPIMCGQARIQWRIDCNTRKNRNIAGGMCSSSPVCTGDKCDALEYTGLLMQWRTACATEKLANGSGGTGGNGDVSAIRAVLTGSGGSVDPGSSLPGSGAWVEGGMGQPVTPDTAGYGWGGGSCPTVPAIEVMGMSFQFDTSPLCRWLSLGSYFVLGLAALGSLRIVSSRDA